MGNKPSTIPKNNSSTISVFDLFQELNLSKGDERLPRDIIMAIGYYYSELEEQQEKEKMIRELKRLSEGIELSYKDPSYYLTALSQFKRNNESKLLKYGLIQ